MPGVADDQVMHVSLTFGDTFLMGSDDPTGDSGPRGGSAIAYVAPDGAAGERTLAALASGGEITMPFGPTFWSEAGFGMCTDKFGVAWMVDTAGEV